MQDSTRESNQWPCCEAPPCSPSEDFLIIFMKKIFVVYIRTNLYIPTTSFSSHNLVKTAPVGHWVGHHASRVSVYNRKNGQAENSHNHQSKASTWPPESRSDPGYSRWDVLDKPVWSTEALTLGPNFYLCCFIYLFCRVFQYKAFLRFTFKIKYMYRSVAHCLRCDRCRWPIRMRR